MIAEIDATANEVEGEIINSFPTLKLYPGGEKSQPILYEGEINSSATVKLPIFTPGINELHGNVEIKWTICTVVNPNINDPDAYALKK